MRCLILLLVSAVVDLFSQKVAAESPHNDQLSQATVWGGVGRRLSCGTTAEATRERDEPRHHGMMTGHSVWYRLVSEHSGTETVATVKMSPPDWFDTVLAVYSGNTLQELNTSPAMMTTMVCTV